MPKMKVTIPHQLGRLEAKHRIQTHVTHARRQHGALLGQVREHWDGDMMDFDASVAGTKVSGQLYVEEEAVRVEIDLPWILAMLSNALRQQLEKEGRQALGYQRQTV